MYLNISLALEENDENFKEVLSTTWSVVLSLIVILGFFIQFLILQFIRNQPSPKRPIDILLFIDQVRI